MEKGAQETFDTVRKQLQQILIRAEQCESASHCEVCVATVCEIVKEIRMLEALFHGTNADRNN